MAKQVELEWLNDDDTNDSAQVGGQQPSRSFMDTIGDAINAIGANFDVVRGSNRIGDLMESLAEPDRGTTEEQYYQNLDKLEKEYAARELAQRKYQDAQDRLVAEDSFLKNITQMGGTLEGMAAQAIGTAGGAALGSLGGFAGASTGAKIGNALGAAAGGYLDARSVALEAREKVLEEGGTWEQAQEAYEEALKKASLTTIPETAVDIILGNRLLGSVSGRIGSSALLDPAAKIGTGVSRAFNPLAGRLAGFATDVALQGSTEALQEVTQDYIADREIAKALNRPDNEYSFGGFGQYAMTPEGLETMKTAGIMGALFGGIGGAISSGKYLQHGAKTREGNMTYHAVKNMEKNGDLYINPDNREAEIQTLAEMLERDGVDESTIRGWSDAELAAASAEVRGKHVARISPLEAQDKSIVRQAADFGNRVLSTDEHRNLKESDLTPESRKLLKYMGIEDGMVDDMFSPKRGKSVLDTTKKEEKTESGEEAKPVVKLTQPTIESMEQGQQQSGTERKTDGVVDDFTLEFGSENDIGENWEKISQGDVQYEDTAIYRNRDNGRIVSVQKTRDGKIQVVDHGFNTDQDKLFNINNFESLPKQQYSSAKEAKQKLLDNDDNKADFRWQGKTNEQKQQQENPVDNKKNIANDIASLAKLHKAGIINDGAFLEFSALLQRAGMTKNEHNIDFQFLPDEISEEGYAQRAIDKSVGRAIVRLYYGADIGSVVHELGHNAYWNLPQEQRDLFNYYAVKSCGNFVANICGENYTQDFVNRLKSGDKKLWEKVRKSSAIKQTRFLLKSTDVVTKGIMSQEEYNFLRQQAIEERYAHELSAWYTEGYTRGIEPQNIKDRIMQRGCISVANELGVLQKVYDYVHHKGGDYGDTPIEEMYKNAYGGFTGATYSTLADQSNLYLGEELNPLEKEEVKKVPEPKPTENKNNKQPKTEYTEEQKAQNEEDKKIQNRKTIDVKGRYKEQQKEKVSDVINQFDQKSQNEVDKLIDIIKNKKSGWQKAIQKLSNYSPSLYMDKLNGIQNSSDQSSLFAFTKTYNNPVVEEKKESTPQPTNENNKKNNNNKQQTQAKPSSETQAKQNELFSQAEQKDPTLGKDGMAVYNKLKDKEKLSKEDKAEIKGIIDRIDALGKQHRYYPLRKNLNNLLNGIKEEPQQKQNSQLEKAITEKPKTLGDSPAARAVKLIKRIKDKNVMDMDEADYFVNELLGAVADLKNWDKEFDGKQDLMGQLKDIVDKIKRGDFFGEEIEEESSVQNDATNNNNGQQEVQTPAPVIETAQPVQEVAQQPQENATQKETGEQRLARLEEELKKLSTIRQIKSRLNKYLNNKDITQQEYDTLSDKLLPKEQPKPKTESKNTTATKTAGTREYIAYAKDKDGNLQKITEVHKNKKDFQASLKQRGYEAVFVAKGEEQYNEYLNKYNEAVEKAKQKEQEKLEADKKKAEELAQKQAEKAALEAEVEARKKAAEAQTSKKKAIEQSVAEKNKKAEEEGIKIIQGIKERNAQEAQEKDNKPKTQPKEKVKTEPLEMNEDTLVENIITKPENGRYLKLEDGKLNYYELVEDTKRGINPANGKPYTKPEAKGYISQEMFDGLLDAWDKLPSEIRFKRETFFRSDRGAFNNLASNTKTQAQQRVYSVCGWSEKREKIAEEKLEKVYDEINRKTEELGISDDYAKVIIDKFIDIDSLVTEGKFTEEKINEAKKDVDSYWDEVSQEDNEEEWNIRKNVHDILMGAIDQAIEINKELDKRDAKNKKPATVKKPAETKEEGQKKDAKKPATTKKPAKPKTETDPFKALHKKFKNVTGGEIGKTTVYKADEKAFIKAWMGRVDDAITSKKETLNDIIKSLEEWKQNNIDQKRTDVIYDYIQNYVIEAGKQFPDAVQNKDNKDTRSQMSTQKRAEQAQQILDRAFPDTRFQFAWHGTYMPFGKFTLKKLSSGAGDQWYGYGLYFSVEPRIGKRYYEMMQNQLWRDNGIYTDKTEKYTLKINGQRFQFKYDDSVGHIVEASIGNRKISTIEADAYFNLIQDYRHYNREIELGWENNKNKYKNTYDLVKEKIKTTQKRLNSARQDEMSQDVVDALAKELNFYKNLLKNKTKLTFIENPDGERIMFVDIPEDNLMLDRDKTLNKQSSYVRKRMVGVIKEIIKDEDSLYATLNIKDGAGIYNELANTVEKKYKLNHRQAERVVSEYMLSNGIQGLKYVDEYDGDARVVFNDQAVTILSEFYKYKGKWKAEKPKMNSEEQGWQQSEIERIKRESLRRRDNKKNYKNKNEFDKLIKKQENRNNIGNSLDQIVSRVIENEDNIYQVGNTNLFNVDDDIITDADFDIADLGEVNEEDSFATEVTPEDFIENPIENINEKNKNDKDDWKHKDVTEMSAAEYMKYIEDKHNTDFFIGNTKIDIKEIENFPIPNHGAEDFTDCTFLDFNQFEWSNEENRNIYASRVRRAIRKLKKYKGEINLLDDNGEIKHTKQDMIDELSDFLDLLKGDSPLYTVSKDAKFDPEKMKIVVDDQGNKRIVSKDFKEDGFSNFNESEEEEKKDIEDKLKWLKDNDGLQKVIEECKDKDDNLMAAVLQQFSEGEMSAKEIVDMIFNDKDTRSQLHSEKDMPKADINSPAFKEWFKGSILKNKDGSPKVFYRGIRGHYDPTYDKEEGGAVWIAEEKQFAEDFRDVVTYEDVVKQTGKVEKLSYIDRGSNIESGDLAEVYANIKKPFNVEQIMRFDSNHDQYVHIGKMLGRDVEKGIITAQQRLQVLRDLSYMNKMTKRGTYPNVGHPLAHHFKDKRFFDAFKKVGYDSIQGYESDVMTYGVFDKGNVKSIYNRGTFNKNDKDIRNMAIGEFGKNSPLANKEFKNKLEQAWEKSYRKWGSRLNYSNEEIEESLNKYKNIEDEKVFDRDQDKLAEIYSRLNDYVNREFWRQGIGKDVEGTRARFRRELDGRWRFYIPDNKMQFKPRINNLLKLKNTGKKLTLDQVIKHDLLFKYYPDLKKIEVEICDSTYDKELKDSTSAYYDENEETIVLNAKDLNGDIKEVQRTMLHEIQHIIQDEEGFAQGGSPEDFAGHQKQLTSFAKGIFKKKEEFRRHLLNKGFDEKTIQAKLDTYFFKDEKSLENIIKNTLNKNPSGKFGKEFKSWIASNNKIYNEYKNLLGEIEARETEKRFDYTDEQLETTPPMLYSDSMNSLKYDNNGKVIARGTRDKRAIKDSRSQLKSEKGMPIADTNTNAFRKWFGNSTAINSDGSPRVFYRGQGHEYDPNYKFDKTDANRNKLTWVAQTKQFIKDGAYNGLDGEGDLWEVYIRTENPFNMGLIDSSTDEAEKTPMELYEHVINKLKREVKYRRITPKQLEETKEKLSYLRQNRRSDGKIQNYKSPIYYFLDKDTKLVGALKDLGYDSILGIEDDTNTFALFDPNQVKSIYNDGTWDSPNDIRSQKIGFNHQNVIKDKNGNPKTFYRGILHTNNRQYDKNEGGVTWFSEDKKFAEAYARGRDGGLRKQSSLIEGNLSIKNSFDFGTLGNEYTDRGLYNYIKQLLQECVKNGDITKEQADNIINKLSYLDKDDEWTRMGTRKKRHIYSYFKEDGFLNTFFENGFDAVGGKELGIQTYGIQNNDNFKETQTKYIQTDERYQKMSKKERKKEQKEYVKKETADAIEKREITDTYKDVYSVSFDESAQNNGENQKKMKYFNDRSEFWDRHESNGTVTYTRKTPFEHHQKVIKYSGINGVQKTIKEKSKPRQWYEWFKDQAIKYLFNDKQYLAKLARHLGVYDAYTRMMVTEGYAQRANVALTEGIMYNGKRTRALNDIIKTVGYQKQKRFLDYCIAHRILNLKERDPKIEQKMSLEEAHEIIEREQNGADAKLFEDNRVDFVDYNKALLHVLVDGGIISEDTFQKFCKNDPDFVPLAKVLDGADLGFNSIIHAHSLINVKSPVKKIGTSMREVKNPFLEMQKRTAEYYSIAARNRAGQIFVNEICGKLDTMFDGDTVQRGAGIIRKVRVDEQNGKLITKPDDQKQIIYVCNNGKHEFYQVADREIYLALKSLSDDQMNTLTKMIDRVAHAPAHLIRESATIVPDFGVRNLIRDNFEAFLTSEHGFIPFFDAMWGVYQMANNTEWYQRYLDQVGEYGTLNRESQRVDNLATYSSTIDDKISYAQNLKEIYKEQMAIIKDTNKAYSDVINEKNSPQRKLLAFIKLFVSPIWAGGKSLKRFNDYMEQGTRIGEFKNAKKKYEGLLDRLGKDALKWNIGFDAIKDNSDIMAAGAAKEITLNFAQHGSLGKMINRWVPFFNATMQGVYKFGNTMDLLFKGNDMSNKKNRRLQKELAFKTALMVAFGIGVAAAGEGDEDYDEAPEWEKKNFWIFPNGMRLPKDQVLGTIVGTAAEESYRQWRKGKAEPSKLLEIICEHFSPNNITPAIIDTMFVGFMANYDSFKKQDIVPEYMKQRRGFLQKDLNTANVAVAISESLYNTLGWDVSAKKIDFAINKNLSNTAKYMNAILDLGLAKNEKMARGYDKSDSTGAFVGGLRDRVPTPLNLVTGTFATNRTSYQSINEFYDKYNKLKIASSHEQSMTEEEKRLWKRYQKAYKEDTKLRKQLREIKNNASLNKDQKREKADPIFKKQIKLAKWAEGE